MVLYIYIANTLLHTPHVPQPRFESRARDLDARRMPCIVSSGKWRTWSLILLWTDPPLLMGTSAFAMVMFNSHVSLPEGTLKSYIELVDARTDC